MPDAPTCAAKSRILIPPPLEPGDLVGIVAASGPAVPEMLDEGVRFLDAAGFRVRPGCHLYECTGYLAGTDEQRCQDLNAMLTDSEIRGVFLARGGYGIMRLLDTIDHEAVRRDPKVLVGMSDVSALLLSLFSHCGLVTWAGPMVAGQVGSGLDPVSAQSFVKALTEPIQGRNLLPDGRSVRVLRPGRARGPLIGGCLSLVTALLGTCHVPDFRGTVLFLEDVNEPMYRIDRMLTHLKLARVLDQVAGIVLGHFSGNNGIDLSPDAGEILSGLIADRQIPILCGFPHGHVLPNLTLPHGAVVELATDPLSLSVPQSSILYG
jgi:muramoyltetrapeptide carboxypeptidase